MSHSSSSMQTAAAFEIRFQSLFNQGRALAFPCDSTGMVNLDAMSEKARNNYLFARDDRSRIRDSLRPASRAPLSRE